MDYVNLYNIRGNGPAVIILFNKFKKLIRGKIMKNLFSKKIKKVKNDVLGQSTECFFGCGGCFAICGGSNCFSTCRGACMSSCGGLCWGCGGCGTCDTGCFLSCTGGANSNSGGGGGGGE